MMERRQSDIRDYLTSSRKNGTSHSHADQIEKSTIEKIPHPLYASPPTQHYEEAEMESDLEDSSPLDFTVDTTIEERLKIGQLFETIKYPLHIPENLQSLQLRFIRKLLQYEEHCHRSAQSDLEDVSWLSSQPFLSGLEQLVRLIQTGELCECPQLAWYLFLVIEPVMMADPCISRNPIIAHVLLSQERLVLRWLAWQEDSPLYLLMALEEDQAVSQSSSRPRTRYGRHTNTVIKSPTKALRSLAGINSVGSATALEFFFRKYLRAAAFLIQHLVQSLGLSTHVRTATWALLIELLEGEEEKIRELHRGRHAWSIIASAIYSTAKLLDEDRSFSQIIASLMEIAAARNDPVGEHWYRSIRLDQGRRGDLVCFYNKVFLVTLRERIYALRQPVTPRRPFDVGNAIPFPSTVGTVSITPNIQLNMSSTPRLVSRTDTTRDSQPSSMVRISMLGHLGNQIVKHTPHKDPSQNESSSSRTFPRKLEL